MSESSSSSHSKETDASASEGAISTIRAWGRRAFRILGTAIGTLLLLIGALLLGLQTDSGATAAAQWLASTVNPLPNTELTVEHASGNWLQSLRLTGVTLSRIDSTAGVADRMAHVDTLAAQYRLLSLLRGRLHVTEASVAGPDIMLRQAADSTWDWNRVLSQMPDDPDTTAGMPVQIDQLHLDRGTFSAAFHTEAHDSTARIRDLHFRAKQFESAASITAQIDTVGLRAQLPGETADLRLAARGGLSDTSLTLDTLEFDSPRSRVRGHGAVRLPTGPSESIEDVAFRLRAAPLALRDLTPFAPTLSVDPRETVDFDLQVAGSGRQLTTSVEGAFSGGGTVTVEGEATPTTTTTPEGPPLLYRLDARIRNLTTSLLGPPDSTENRLNTTLNVDVRGQSLTTLDGTADLRLADTRWGGIRTPTLDVTSTLRDGEAAIDLQGTLNEAQIRADGRTRPLDEAPSAVLTAHVRTLDVAAFAPDAGIESNLSATLEAHARDLGATDQETDLALSLESSELGVQQIESGRVALALRPDSARFEGRLALPGGRVEAEGFTALDGSERFALTHGQLNDLNAAALVGDTTASRISGTVRLTGRGFSPESMTADASATLRDSHYGPYQLASLSGNLALSEGRLDATTEATLNGGTWTLDLAGHPFDATPSFELTRGRFRNVDIGPFLRDTTQSSRLHGTVAGTVQGTDPATMSASTELTLDTSRVNRQRIDSANLSVGLQEARINGTLQLDTPKGGTRLTAAARPFDAEPTFQVTEGSFDDLDVGAIANVQGLSTALSGALTADGQGASASTLVLDAGLSFSDSRINDATLSDGQISVTTDAGRATTDAEVAVAGGRMHLSGHVDSLETTPTYELQTTLDSIDAGALAGLDTLSAHVGTLDWTLNGRGMDPNTLTSSTRLSGRGIQLDRFTVDDVNLRGQFRQGQLVVDTLTATSNAFETHGRGTLAVTDTAASSDFVVETTVTDVQPLQRLVGAETLRLQKGRFEAHVYGSSTAAQRFDGEVTLQGLMYDDLRLASAEVDFNGRRGQTQLFQHLELRGRLGYASAPALAADQTRFDAIYDGTAVDLSGTVRLDQTHSASLGATVTSSTDQTEVALHKLNLRFENDRWSLLQETTITASDQYHIDGLLLRSNDQQIAVDGIVDPAGTQNIVATVDEVRLAPVSSLFDLSGLGGSVSGSLDLTGPANAPELDSRLSLNLRSENRDIGTLHLEAAYRELTLDLDANLTHTDGSTLAAEGQVPVDLRLQSSTRADVANDPVRLDLSTERFPVNWIDPFLDPATVRDIRGTLSANVEVRGTLDEPNLDGRASLMGGAATLPPLETTYRGASATLAFTEDRVTLDKASLSSSNGGRLQAEGVINFPQLTVAEYDVRLNASNFIAIDTRAYRRAIIDGTMTVSGTTQRPVLTGTVQVRSADIYFNEALAESAAATTAAPLTEEDQLTLEKRFGVRLSAADTTTFDAFEALEMDLSVRIQRNTWLRSRRTPEMNVQFMGDLDVTKARNEDPQVFGSIEVVTDRSTLRQFGQEFQITEGTLTFNGDPYTPYLALEAVYEQRAQGTQGAEVAITLRLEGRGENLSPTLSSDPPMDTRNILSYLATGRPADELLSGGGENGNFATQMALGQASNFVENLAASELGLDVVRVQIRTSGASYLTVGRYFTPRFFASIQQPVATSNLSNFQSTQYLPDLTLEYQLMDTLMLRALNSQQSLQLDLLFEYAY